VGERVSDEILETIWMLDEEGRRQKDDIAAKTGEPEAEKLLATMELEGLVVTEGDQVMLTERGKEIAEGIIRRHRLAERLLFDILEMERGEIETHACEFEHILSAGVVDSICTLLGHPPTCPHGKPIPRGDCCERHQRHVGPVVVPLTELPVGEEARIVFIRARTHERFHRLSPLGIVPGSTIRMHQTRPSVVVEIGETSLAIDEEIAQEIYVRPLHEPAHNGPRRRGLGRGGLGRGRRVRMGWWAARRSRGTSDAG